MVDVQEYLDANGKSPFGKWFAGLNAPAAAKITAVLEKIANGNLSNVEGVGEGVYEYKLNWGAGYRVYFGKDGEKLVILVGGGAKKRSRQISRRRRPAGPNIRDAKEKRRCRWH